MRCDDNTTINKSDLKGTYRTHTQQLESKSFQGRWTGGESTLSRGGEETGQHRASAGGGPYRPYVNDAETDPLLPHRSLLEKDGRELLSVFSILSGRMPRPCEYPL